MPLIASNWMNNNGLAFLDGHKNSLQFYHAKLNITPNKKLIAQAYQIYMQVQNKIPLINKEYKPAELVIFSRSYRAIVKALIVELQDSSRNMVEDDLSQIGNLNEIEFLWNLLEIICFNVAYSDLIVLPLMQWVTWHFTEPSISLNELLTKNYNLDKSVELWTTLYSLVLQGQIDIVCEVLKSFNTIKENSLCDLIITNLENCPMLNIAQNNTLTNFQYVWTAWKKECEEMLGALSHFPATGSLHIKNGLTNILRIAIGQESAFEEFKHLCQPWYALFISKLFYQNPTVKTFELPIHLKKFLNENPLPSANPIDDIVQFAFKFEILNVLTEICLHFDDWWFPAHLADLLARTIDLNVPHVRTECDIREYIMLEFVSGISNHPSLWTLLPGYLDTCPTFGNAHLQIYLEKLPLTTEIRALKIFALCQRRAYTSKAASVCRQIAQRYTTSKQYGSAMGWALKMDDYTMVDHIVVKILNEGGDFLENHGDDVAGSIADISHKTPLLAFLTKYRDLKLCEEADGQLYRESLLMSLISAPLPSPKFAFTFLELLDKHILNFPIQTPDSIYEILRWMDESFQSNSILQYSAEQNDLLARVSGNLRKHLALLNLTCFTRHPADDDMLTLTI